MQKEIIHLFWANEFRELANNPKLAEKDIVDEFLKFCDREENALRERLKVNKESGWDGVKRMKEAKGRLRTD